MTLEKNGSLNLSPEEIEQIKKGKVPTRIASSDKSLNAEELDAILKSGDYQEVGWIRPEPGTEAANT